jgi:glycosyltransferase involved in cell wall biosynthesis
VHFHLSTAFYILLSILFNRKPLYVETIHNRADKTFTNKLSFIFKYLLFRFKLVKVCSISDENTKSIQDIFKIKDINLIYNGRALPAKSKEFESVVKEIKDYKKHQDDIVFVHIGRFVAQKNQEMLVTAFNQLNQLGYNFTLLIIGDGFQSKKGTVLKSKACPRIHFLGVRSNIADYLLNADGFCLSSFFEGMPISLIESFACGCTPICTPTSGAIDIIKNGKNGFLSINFNEEEYVKALLNFINHYSEIKKIELIKYYLDNFAINKCAQKYVNVFLNKD